MAELREAEEKFPFVKDTTKILYKKYPATIKSSPNMLLKKRGRKVPFLFLLFFLRREKAPPPIMATPPLIKKVPGAKIR